MQPQKWFFVAPFGVVSLGTAQRTLKGATWHIYFLEYVSHNNLINTIISILNNNNNNNNNNNIGIIIINMYII